MASLSEHYSIIEAALVAARKDGFMIYVDNMEPSESGDYAPPTLNLWGYTAGERIDFDSDIWSWS